MMAQEKNKTDRVAKLWILKSPDQCRDFLKHLKSAGRQVDLRILKDGKYVSVDEATDLQVVAFANQIARDMPFMGIEQ